MTTQIIVDFSKQDAENPRNWSKARKMVNVAIIALMASERHLGNHCACHANTTE